MLELYTGTPGSGKSLDCAQDIYYWLRRGKHVLANFDIKLDIITRNCKKDVTFVKFNNNDITPDVFVQYSRDYRVKKEAAGGRCREGELKIIFDEAQTLFSSRRWQTLDPAWLSFFSQSRKYFYDIVLICQFDGMLDKQIRSLVEYEIKHRKLSNFGLFGKVLNLIFGGRTFCRIKYWYPIGERLGSEFFHYRKRFGDIYDTYEDFELGDHILTAKEVKAINAKKNKESMEQSDS